MSVRRITGARRGATPMLLWLALAVCAGAVESGPGIPADAWQPGWHYLRTEAEAGGEVLGAGDGWYPAGMRVTVAAVPDPGYRFSRWTGDVPESDQGQNPLRLLIDRTRAIAATFVRVVPEAPDVELVVRGEPEPHGFSRPYGYGTNRLFSGTLVRNTVTSPVERSDTRFVCTGWVGEGDVPATGSDTVVVFTATTDSVLTWQWKQQYWLFITTILLDGPEERGGEQQPPDCSSVDVTEGWFDAGSNVVLTATAPPGFAFVEWLGDVPEDQKTNNPSSVTMDGGSVVAAGFVRLPPTPAHFVSPSGGHRPPFASWQDAARDIQAAVDAAVDGDAVWVSNGTYEVDAPIAIRSRIALRSVHGPKVTAVRARAGTGCIAAEASRVTIAGFTVSGGQAVEGGGISIGPLGAVRDCIMVGNRAERGGGIFCIGGAVIRNCLIADNEAQAGGGVYTEVFSRIENCTITRNRAARIAGGLWGRWGNAVLNSILYDNAAAEHPNWSLQGAAHLRDSAMLLHSAHNCAAPPLPGRGNIDAEPRFVAPDGGDWRLRPESPCIDRGLNLPWMAGAADLDGRDRVLGGVADLGAYEFEPPPEPEDVVLTVEGSPEPRGVSVPYDYGMHRLPPGTAVTNTVVTPPRRRPGIRYVCGGWTGTGAVPASGAGTTVVFTATADSTLTWHWRRQYRLETGVIGDRGREPRPASGRSCGSVDVGDGWHDSGTTVTITAQPSANCYFVGWVGNLPAHQRHENPLQLVMERPLKAFARFLRDTDDDGMSDEAEALAGTSPLDGGDILEITGIRGLSASEETILRRGEATDGVELRWRTKEGKRYRVMTGDDVLGPFSAVATNIPGTGGTAVYVDRKAAGRSRGFYRVELDGE